MISPTSLTMRTLALLAAAAAFVVLCSSVHSAVAGRRGPLVTGGWTPIGDVNAVHIQQLGSWAVTEHVKRAHDGLRFARVVSGEEQVVAGTNYKLVIDATDGAGKDGTYGAVVYEDLTETLKLISFEPAN